MKPARSVSLVIADTESYVLARRAVERTVAAFPVDEVLVFSDDARPWAGFDVRPMPRITSYADYNRVMLADLAGQLRTDFALVIQFDGFVSRPAAFSDFFFHFDYVGAVWPAGLQVGKTRLPAPMVGNGGFSLRSRRLVEAVARRLQAVDLRVPEDATVCRYLRPVLEEQDGMVFAPPEVARHFSVELEPVAGILPFGFHGLHLLPQAYAGDHGFLLDNLPARCLVEGTYQCNNLSRGMQGLGPQAVADLKRRIRPRVQVHAGVPTRVTVTAGPPHA